MPRRMLGAGLVGLGLVVALGGAAGAQHGTGSTQHGAGGAGHQHGGQAPGGHGPGAGAGHELAGRCEEDFARVVAEGRGFGLAFAADQQGYPGPIHALELADHLRLDPGQRARLEALRDGMLARARPAAARWQAAEDRLRRLFAEGRADEAGVRAAVADVERARAELRLVHLLTHLETRAVLDEGQRQRYHQARWGRPGG